MRIHHHSIDDGKLDRWSMVNVPSSWYVNSSLHFWAAMSALSNWCVLSNLSSIAIAWRRDEAFSPQLAKSKPSNEPCGSWRDDSGSRLSMFYRQQSRNSIRHLPYDENVKYIKLVNVLKAHQMDEWENAMCVWTRIPFLIEEKVLLTEIWLKFFVER